MNRRELMIAGASVAAVGIAVAGTAAAGTAAANTLTDSQRDRSISPEDHEHIVAALLEGRDLSHQDRNDLRPLLITYISSPNSRILLPIIRRIAGTHKDWRTFLTSTNIGAFFDTKRITMLKLSVSVNSGLDFEADFYGFMADQFVAHCRVT